ncbi:IS66 family transposase [Sodalis sp. dw_96]|uniref:IS66 family transposase n=1 Tax=Sodalis sp. dw_96 TaxID=2719794 RepID=UPI001BD679D7|nr:IS66 family transposase [Sodalis sp. dw_96]
MDIDSLLASQNPDDLRSLALKLLADLEQKTQKNQALAQYIQQLEEALKNARHWRFGRKSEAFQGEQRGLFDEDIEADAADIEQQLATLLPEPKESLAATPKRRPLPPELPREDIHLAPASDSCPDCGHALRFIRDEISERLEYVPARFIVHRHIRPQFSCEHCDTVVSAPLPAQLIEKGQPGPGLLAQVVSAKCLDHLPLYRQQVIYQRSGVDIPRSTLAGWFGAVGAALKPLAERLHHDLLQHPVLQADETTLSILDPGKGKTLRGYLWAYVTAHSAEQAIVLYDCQPGRSGQYARDILDGWHGILVVDGYSGYQALFGKTKDQEKAEDKAKAKAKAKEAGCMAHVRRKFFELFIANKSPVAKQALDIIRELYKLERKIKHRPVEKQRQWRQRYAKPQMDAFHKWLLLQHSRSAPNSGLRRALDYTLNRWPALLCYLEDGRVPIDNNRCENAMRPVAVGRKNWLFAGSLRAGQRMAAILSLLETAKLNGHDPYIWLRDVLTRLPTWPNNRIAELLPYAENSFS